MSLRHLLLIVLFSFVTGVVSSQPPDNQPPNPQTDPDRVPITGLEYLLIGGGVYGVSRFLKNRKNKHNQS